MMQSTNTSEELVRTTISLPESIYEQVRMEAFEARSSISKVIAAALTIRYGQADSSGHGESSYATR